MKRIAPNVLPYLVGLAIALAISLGVPAIDRIWPTPVQAASENGCSVIGVVGTVIVARCEDEDTGMLIWANSAGFMVVEP